jgi:DNA polymerase-3 subunit epsilon/ATP-dependent DNA helicase DinG
VWSRISADGADCTSDTSPYVVDGTCFLQRARKRAEASHIVVVNHALLLSDVGTGGRVLPPYHHLIVDEAHHLEDEATRQFGFTCGQRELADLLHRCEGLPGRLSRSARGAPGDAAREIAAAASALAESVKAARKNLDLFCAALSDFRAEQSATGDDGRLHITRAMRVQPGWTGVELGWDNATFALRDISERLHRLHEVVSAAGDLGMLNHDLTISDIADCHDRATAYLSGLAVAIESEDAGRVVWLETDRRDGAISLAWVPLAVADLLREGLYAEERSLVLTGATLSVRGGFEFLQHRLGLEDCHTLALGSPFDYRRAALVVVPRDMPEPDAPPFMDALAASIIDLARASEGRALALFTSHSMLRATHERVSAPLRDYGIRVLGQGIDGSPKHLVEGLKNRPSTIVLGTSSLWEGVDIPGDALSLLIVARLPFAVPSDPIVAARSEVYDDPFGEYSLPQAVIRFRQGFGRLIRSKADRGVLVVLDRRIVTRQYGATFLQSLPGCPVRQVALRELPGIVGGFLSPVLA